MVTLKMDAMGYIHLWEGVVSIPFSEGLTKVYLDGACGFGSMERIAKAIGIKLQRNKESDKYKNHTFYTAIAN